MSCFRKTQPKSRNDFFVALCAQGKVCHPVREGIHPPFTASVFRKRENIVIKVEYLDVTASANQYVLPDDMFAMKQFISSCRLLEFVLMKMDKDMIIVGKTLDKFRSTWKDSIGPYCIVPCVGNETSQCVVCISKKRLKILRLLQLSLVTQTLPTYPIFMQIFSRTTIFGYRNVEVVTKRSIPDVTTIYLDGSAVNIKQENIKETMEIMSIPEIDQNSHAWLLYGICLKFAVLITGCPLFVILKTLPTPHDRGFSIMEHLVRFFEFFPSSTEDMNNRVKKSITMEEAERKAVKREKTQSTDKLKQKNNGDDEGRKENHLYSMLQIFLLQRSTNKVYILKSAIDDVYAYCESEDAKEEFSILLSILAASCAKDSTSDRILLKKSSKVEKSVPLLFYWYEFCFSRGVSLKKHYKLELLMAVFRNKLSYSKHKTNRFTTSTTCKASHLQSYYKTLWQYQKESHASYIEFIPCPGRNTSGFANMCNFLRLASYAADIDLKAVGKLEDLSGNCDIDSYLLHSRKNDYGNLPAIGIQTPNTREFNKCSNTDQLETGFVRFEDFLVVWDDNVTVEARPTDIPVWAWQEMVAQHSKMFYEIVAAESNNILLIERTDNNDEKPRQKRERNLNNNNNNTGKESEKKQCLDGKM